MIGWILIVTAVTMIAAIFVAIDLWLWIDYRVIKRVAKRVQVENDNLVAQNADLYDALKETIAERDGMALQLEQALKPKERTARARKEKAQQ